MIRTTPKKKYALIFFFFSLDDVFYRKIVCLIGIALGKYVIVMCLDFKEDDSSLRYPVTFGFFFFCNSQV